MAQLYFDNDNNVVVKGLRLSSTSEYVNDATMTLTLYHKKSGDLVTDGSISFSYTTGSNGDYRALVSASGVKLTVGDEIKAVVTCSNYGVRLVRTLRVLERAS